MELSKMTLQEFLLAARLADQSDIVTYLLQTEKDDEFQACYYNKYDCLISSPHHEEQIIPSTLFYDRHEFSDEFDDVLPRHLDRFFFEWRLIPAWLAYILIRKGETVFKYGGCSWWGIQDIHGIGISHEEMLKEIYDEITEESMI
ncbi:hypothetical protein M9991_12430 [Chryseobacterium gallinarum]|uniref:hypothetical protein n=1 Tax=Chryseobacterium gallinarum TaxID=1324352 RepID=UPI0020243E12|nr:hypothetical protein [Chryseobacterium gallinarum]MCL8537671.1 hypothetical protein [Chryseobacterium gallinarum]